MEKTAQEGTGRGQTEGCARRLAIRASARSLLVLLLIFHAPIASAQLYTGSLTGVVVDSAGALIPRAAVSLVNEDNGFSFTAQSNGEGRYLIRGVPPGKYRVSVSAASFSTELKQGITVDVNENVAVNFSLKAGNVNQVIEVNSSDSQLQKLDAVTGQVVSRKLIADLPLLSRQVTDLAYLAPGITDVDTACVGCYANNFVSNGSRNMTADIVMDGVSTSNFDQNSGIQEPLYLPSVDAVEEFKVQQSNFSAEFGFSGSTVLNLVTRSGTNAFHGSLFEYIRNSALDANNWFNDQSGIPIPPLKHNDFGGTIGGPIKKDKAFFFFDYDGVRDVTEFNAQAGVPSAAEKTGDFGELCGQAPASPDGTIPAGGMFDATGTCTNPAGQLWDPYSGTYSSDAGGAVRSASIPYNNLASYQSAGSPALAGTPYQLAANAGNLIDPVAAKLIQDFPAPNLTSTGGYNPYNNWIGSGPNPATNNQWDLKIDYQFHDKAILTGKYSQQSATGHGWNCFGNVADPCTGGPYDLTAHLLALNYTYTFNASTQLNISFGGNRQVQFQHSILGDYPKLNPVTLLGEQAYMLRSGIPQIPAITLGSYNQAGSASNVAIGSAPYSYFHQGSESYPLIGSVSWVHKSHEFKFGAEGRLHRINFIQPGNPGGQFSFDYTGTSAYPSAGFVPTGSPAAPGGDALASFLTGVNTSGLYEVPLGTSTENYQASGFFQDNWKALPTLTLNVGVRYDVSLPRTERHNKMNWLDANVVSPLQVPGLGVLRGGEVFANNHQRTNFDTDFRDLQPRFGFAWQFIPDTVLRGGFGMYYSTSEDGAAGNGAGGFQGFDQFTASITSFQNDGATPYGRLNDPYPGIGPKFPPGNSLGLLNDLGNGAAGPIRSMNHTPYEETWSFGLQRQFPWKLVMQADYVGKRGIHLYYGGDENLNHLGPSVESASADEINTLNSYVANPFYGYITDPNSALSSPTVPAFQLELPYPQFGSFSSTPPPVANSIYHALQFKAEKQLASGLQFLFTYVFSKSIDNASTTSGAITFLGGQTSLQDPNNIDGERSVSAFDIPNVFQFSSIYELPLGRGRVFGGHMNRIADTVIGGWQLNDIYRYSNGRPVLITLQGGQSLPTYGAQRPNISGKLQRSHGPESNWLNNYFANPEVVSVPAAFTLGNVPRALASVRQPGQNTLTLSVFKEFPLPALREGTRAEFRFEAFNALNHPQFGGPNTSFNSGQFGLITSSGNERQVQAALKLYF